MAEDRCVSCGEEIPSGTSVCPACGADQVPPADATAAFTPVAEAEEAIAAAEVAAGAGPALVVKKGPDAGERFALATDVVTIGRDPASDIFLNDITVSRRHAQLERGAGGYTVSDVGSLNGTYINGERVESRSLVPGDEIQIGKFRLVFT